MGRDKMLMVADIRIITITDQWQWSSEVFDRRPRGWSTTDVFPTFLHRIQNTFKKSRK